MSVASLQPLITERAITLTKGNWYTFRVPVNYRKNRIRQLVEGSYGVEVVAVRTLIVKGEKKRSLRTRRTRQLSDWKKAMIRLKEGQKIAVFDVTGS